MVGFFYAKPTWYMNHIKEITIVGVYKKQPNNQVYIDTYKIYENEMLYTELHCDFSIPTTSNHPGFPHLRHSIIWFLKIHKRIMERIVKFLFQEISNYIQEI